MKFENAVARFRQGTLTPREYLEQCIAIIDEKEPRIRAFSHLDIERARRQADASTKRYELRAPVSAIDGMPIGIKDIIDIATQPTGMGSEIYRGWTPLCSAEAVDALNNQGAVILGKTQSTEFAIGRATITTNPYDVNRTPGGSSSGTAAGVSSGMFCAGLGTQTQGSIIRPASYCGVVGFKPTWGALPLRGTHPVSYSHDHLGVIAQTVDIAWSLAQCIMQYRPNAINIKINGRSSLDTDAFASPRIAVLRTSGLNELNCTELAAFDDCVNQYRRLGINISDSVDDPALRDLCRALDDIPAASAEMVASDMLWPYDQYCKTFTDRVSEKIHDMVARGKQITPQRYHALRDRKAQILEQLTNLSDRYDIFLLPSSSGIAPLGLENTGSRTLAVYASYLGIPAVSLPATVIDGMPMGLQLLSTPFSDYELMCRAKYLFDSLQKRNLQ